MKIINCDQKSSRWLAAKCGRVGASSMSKIVTHTGNATANAARETFKSELVWERLTGDSYPRYVSKPMDRGNALEDQARAWFELETGLDVRQVGFCMHDSEQFGVSPDGLINPRQGLEIKTATECNHIRKLLDDCIPAENMIQIQAGLWICDCDLWHFVLYTDDPRIPNMYKTVERIPAIIDALAEHVPAFCMQVDALERQLRDRYGLESRKVVNLDAISGDWCPFGGGD